MPEMKIPSCLDAAEKIAEIDLHDERDELALADFHVSVDPQSDALLALLEDTGGGTCVIVPESGTCVLPVDASAPRRVALLRFRRPTDEGSFLAERGIPLGLRHAPTSASLLSGGIPPVEGPADGSLLLLHGLFSHASRCFRGLGVSDAYPALADHYGEQIYAFNHRTVEQGIRESARALLLALPEAPRRYDVVAHSRGGLVLRAIVERPDLFGDLAGRFRLGRVVLACVPNHGTKLASREGLMALLLGAVALRLEGDDLDDPNFLRALRSWIEGSARGVADMSPTSAFIESLNTAQGRPIERYHALAANYEPGGLLQAGDERLFDALHGEANDIAVATADSMRCGADTIASTRVFAPTLEHPSCAVHHLNIFRDPEARRFVVDRLTSI